MDEFVFNMRAQLIWRWVVKMESGLAEVVFGQIAELFC